MIVTWAYALVVAGMWFTISPWRLRDLLNWATATDTRIRVGSGVRLAFGLFVAVLGLTVFRQVEAQAAQGANTTPTPSEVERSTGP